MGLIPFLVGAILGLRFKVSILIPVVLIGSVAIFGVGIAKGENFLSILIAAFLMTIALQIGYLAGAFMLFALTNTHIREADVMAMPQRR